MKKHVQKLLAGVIALAMILGNLAGTGVTVARASGVVEDPELNVRVINEKGNPVSGVQLILKNDELGNIEFDDVTDQQGETTAAEALLDVTKEATYYVQPAPDDKEHICNKPLEVHFVMSTVGYGNMPCIDTVDGKKYDGSYVELTVKGAGTGTPVVNPVISSVASSVKEAHREGENATITVTGTELQAKMYYQIWYVMQGQKDESLPMDEVGTVQTVETNGNGTERTFNVKLPVVSEYPKAIGWKVSVAVASNEYGKGTEIINIAKDAATGEVTALGVAIKDAESRTAADYTVKSWKAYSAAIEAAKLLQEDVNAPNSQCRAALQQIEKTKTALILIKDLATAATKASLDSTLKEASRLKEADYTAASWKAYSAAVNAGKALAADEDATEVRCQAAIKQIKDAKAALVKKVKKVSKITISGASKSIAVGKSVQLTAKVSPAKAANKAVKWTVSNKKYATVTSKGKVTVKKAGAGKTVTVTATAKDGSRKKATYRIKIMKDTVKSIKLKAAKTVKAGKNVKVTATVKTTGKKANKTLQWTSSNSKYATVSAKGVVKTKKAGKNKTVKITAKATDGSNKKYTVKIKIK